MKTEKADLEVARFGVCMASSLPAVRRGTLSASVPEAVAAGSAAATSASAPSAATMSVAASAASCAAEGLLAWSWREGLLSLLPASHKEKVLASRLAWEEEILAAIRLAVQHVLLTSMAAQCSFHAERSCGSLPLARMGARLNSAQSLLTEVWSNGKKTKSRKREGSEAQDRHNSLGVVIRGSTTEIYLCETCLMRRAEQQ